MSGHQRTALIVTIAVALVIGACGTATTTTPGAGSATTPMVTSTPTATATPAASPISFTTQILVTGMLQQTQTPESGVYLVDSDGSNLHRLDAEGSLDSAPNWSPDGRQIAFTRLFEPPSTQPLPKMAIGIMDADGSNVRILTDQDGVALNPVWSPDGSRIAFERVPSLPEGDASPDAVVSVMNADGSNLHDVGEVGYLLGAPSWSPDSSRLTFMGTTQAEPAQSLGAYIWVVNADGSDLRHIVGQGEVMWPDWSPDGSTIIYLNYIPGNDPTAGLASLTIDAVAPDGSNTHSLTGDQVQVAFFPAWSVEGTQIAFDGRERGANGEMETGIYVMNADGSNLHQLVQGVSGRQGDLVLAPSWSPDGREIAFVAIPDIARQVPPMDESEPAFVSAELRVTATDGSAQRTLVSPLFVEPAFDPFDTVSNVAPDWRPVTP